MALDEASVQVPDAFILLRCFGSNKRPIEMYQIHLDQVEIGFYVENRARFLGFS